MPRAATTSDVFNAIAEPRRRDILDFLRDGRPRTVTQLVDGLRLAQPSVSKHLSVLRQVGVVSVTRQGQQRLYRLRAEELKAVHEWVKTFEQYWTHQIERIKAKAEAKARNQEANPS